MISFFPEHMEQVSQEIDRYVVISSTGPTAIIFVTKVGRYTIQYFVNHFGTSMYKYLIVVFTCKDELDFNGISMNEYISGGPSSIREILRLAGNR